MSIRQLLQIEQDVKDAVLQFGKMKQWEFSGVIDLQNAKLIELKTEMLDHKCEPSSDVFALARNGYKLTLHHNHLSGESLSGPDWNGACLLFSEIFAHCTDGTSYYGKVIEKNHVLEVITPIKYESHTILAERYFTIHYNNLFTQTVPPLPVSYNKEIINRAMKLKGFIEYEFDWGSQYAPTPSQMELAINLAANDLSQKM